MHVKRHLRVSTETLGNDTQGAADFQILDILILLVINDLSFAYILTLRLW